MKAPTMRMSEKDWQATVLEAAKLMGWREYHPYDSRRSTPGWPDLVLWHPKRRRVIFRELKTDLGKLSAAQRDTLAELEHCGLNVGVWRPAGWDGVLVELSK